MFVLKLREICLRKIR